MHVFFAESLETFTADLQRARPTVFFSVPRLWVKFQQAVDAKMPPAKLQRLLRIPIVRGLVSKKILRALGLDACAYAAGGAAPMPPELLRWYARLGLPIAEVYGMTENCGVSHATLRGVERLGTVGQPYDGVETRIDPASGEIQMRSPGVMLGYYKEPGLTAEAIDADGWLHTGDKGALDAEGNLRITGRVKDLFKTSKGKYVAPAPIEDRLVMNGAVEACVVTGANLGQPLGIVMLNADAAAALGGARRPGGARGLAGRAPDEGQRRARSARAARLPGGGGRAVVGGERLHHADLQGQAQPDRGGLRAAVRTLDREPPAGGLAHRLAGRGRPGPSLSRPSRPRS